MTTVTVHYAKTHLSKLIAAAERGEEVVIARGDKPAVRLTPLEPTLPAPPARRWRRRCRRWWPASRRCRTCVWPSAIGATWHTPQ